MSIKRVLVPLVGFAVSALFIWLVLRSMDLAQLGSALAAAKWGWIFVAVLMLVIDFSCRIWRWRLMLVAENPEVGWLRCSVPFMASIAANNVLPLRAGDALRTVAFSGWFGVSTASILASMVVERVLDLLVLLLALAAALAFFGLGSSTLGALLTGGSILLMTGALVLALLLIFPQSFEPFVRLSVTRIGRHWPVLGQKIEAAAARLILTLRVLTRGRRAASLLFWSVLAWAFEGAIFYSTAHAIPDLTHPAAAWLAMPLGTLATMLPSTPGYVGTFHYFVVRAAEIESNPIGAAGAFAILTHLVLWVSATAWGAASFVFWIAIRAGQPSSPGAST